MTVSKLKHRILFQKPTTLEAEAERHTNGSAESAGSPDLDMPHEPACTATLIFDMHCMLSETPRHFEEGSHLHVIPLKQVSFSNRLETIQMLSSS